MSEPNGEGTRRTNMPGLAVERITGSVFRLEFPSNIQSWEELEAGRDSLIATGCHPNSILVHAGGDLTMTAQIPSPNQHENYNHPEKLLDRTREYVTYSNLEGSAELKDIIDAYFEKKYGRTK